MAAGDPPLVPAVKNRVDGNQVAVLEDVDLLGCDLYGDLPAHRRVRHAVIVAIDRDHAVAADPALQTEDLVERPCGQELQSRLLGCERFVDDAVGGAVDAAVGDFGQPLFQLGVQVGQVTERAPQEEVLPDVPERPLDLALGLGPVRGAGPWPEPVVVRQ